MGVAVWWARVDLVAWRGWGARHRTPLSLLLVLLVTLCLGPAAHLRPRGVPADAVAVLLIPIAGMPAAPRRTVALTFDDGPSPYTQGVLTVLRRHRVKATFCMLGNQAARYPGMARRVARDGHRICNHSRDHADLRRLTTPAARREVTDAQRQIRSATGVTATVFRFPYGASNARVRGIVRSAGLRELRWNVDTQDWRKPLARTITARATARRRSGAVILLHDGGGDRSRTVASLDLTITTLQREGYTFVVA
jgi:peptidoglycan/xylan/chitin deacetylase (PgdA/CDA1 family)